MYHPDQSKGRIRQPRNVDWTPIYWRVLYIGDYIAVGPCDYGEVKLMQLHYHYPKYYLPLERNQDSGRMGEKSPLLDMRVGIPMEVIVGLPMDTTVVLTQT